MLLVRLRRSLAGQRLYLSPLAAVLMAILLAVLLRQSEAYVPRYQTFPLADWLEFALTPNEGASFGSAETAAWRGLPALAPFSLGVANYTLPTSFKERHLRRRVSGLQSSYSLGLSTPLGPADEGPWPSARLRGRLDVRVFHNSGRARTYGGLRAVQLETSPGAFQVAPHLGPENHRIWVSFEPLEQDIRVQVVLLGDLGPAAYEVAVRGERRETDWSGNVGELADRTQRITEAIAQEWRRQMQRAWVATGA